MDHTVCPADPQLKLTGKWKKWGSWTYNGLKCYLNSTQQPLAHILHNEEAVNSLEHR